MYQTLEHSNEIVIHLKAYDELSENKYVAWIEGDDYRNMLVSADTVLDCMQELGKSLHVLELYRQNLKT